MQAPAMSQLTGKIDKVVTVEMTVADLPVSPQECWSLIATHKGTSQWFGDLPHELTSGSGELRLDFNDGDYFTIYDVDSIESESLEYSWRFLGLGSGSRIQWHITPAAGGSTLTLTDTNPKRKREQSQELLEGWTDFLQRLQRHVATGENTRYPFRSEFDACTEVPTDTKETLRLIGDQGLEDLMKRIVAATDPAQTVTGVSDMSESSLTFSVLREHWEAPTRCIARVSPSQTGGSTVYAEQCRWDAISRDPEICRSDRKLYSTAWILELSRLTSFGSYR